MSPHEGQREASASATAFVRAPKRESSLQKVPTLGSIPRKQGSSSSNSIAQLPMKRTGASSPPQPLGTRSPKASVTRSTPLVPRTAHQASVNRSSITTPPVDAFGNDVGPLGLGLKLEESSAFTAPLHIKKRSSTAPASSSPTLSTSPPSLNSQRSPKALSKPEMPFPDFCIPELSDPSTVRHTHTRYEPHDTDFSCSLIVRFRPSIPTFAFHTVFAKFCDHDSQYFSFGHRGFTCNNSYSRCYVTEQSYGQDTQFTA